MATGTVKWFNDGVLAMGNKAFNLGSDTLKLGIVTTATVPTLTTAVPHWGGTGTTNFATNQVATAGTSYTGPQTLASVTWTNAAGVLTLAATPVTLNQDASGFTNGAYGIIYDDTDTSKRAIGFVEINSGGTASLASGQLIIDWNGATNNNILTITPA